MILDKRPARNVSRGGGKESDKVKNGKAAERPGWASGLRQLYDTVVDEPLPDAFKDLLSKLDDKS